MDVTVVAIFLRVFAVAILQRHITVFQLIVDSHSPELNVAVVSTFIGNLNMYRLIAKT